MTKSLDDIQDRRDDPHEEGRHRVIPGPAGSRSRRFSPKEGSFRDDDAEVGLRFRQYRRRLRAAGGEWTIASKGHDGEMAHAGDGDDETVRSRRGRAFQILGPVVLGDDEIGSPSKGPLTKGTVRKNDW
jgi:hypothetical protein